MIQRPMTPEQFANCAEQTTKQYGMAIVGWHGNGTIAGVTADMSYDGHTVRVDVKNKPFLLPMKLCTAYINKWLDVFAPPAAA